MGLSTEEKDIVVGGIDWSMMEYVNGQWKCGSGNEWCALTRVVPMRASSELDDDLQEDVDRELQAWSAECAELFEQRLSKFTEKLRPSEAEQDPAFEGMEFSPIVRLGEEGFEVLFGYESHGAHAAGAEDEPEMKA